MDAPKFLGAQSCSASSCHGGAGQKSNQYTTWSTRDFHHERPFATLTTARSERLAEVLKLGNPAQSPRCTVCHAPFATVPAERLSKEAKITEGVSCESCHGAAENWIRSHTRPDYTRADRVAAGMRDLKNLYVRANTCVACHQVLPQDIRAAGHPELIFEMDGQGATMPRHWAKAGDRSGFEIWLTGQLVAAREMSAALAEKDPIGPKMENPWNAVVWVVQSALAHQTTQFRVPPCNPENLREMAANCDRLARELGPPRKDSSAEAVKFTRRSLLHLVTLPPFVNDPDEVPLSWELKSRRAERMVLALDRLTMALPEASTNRAVSEALNQLFADVQSLPDFKPDQFAKDLKAFQASVSTLESK